MTIRYVNIPLYQDEFYGYSITLEGNSYNLEFLYNSRMKLYLLSLFTADGTPLVRGQAVVPDYPMLMDYALPDLSGFFWMQSVPELDGEYYKEYPKDISSYYRMFYIYNDEN